MIEGGPLFPIYSSPEADCFCVPMQEGKFHFLAHYEQANENERTWMDVVFPALTLKI
jgi:hypothetical protein